MSTVETISKKSCASKQGSRANWGIQGTILAFAYVPALSFVYSSILLPLQYIIRKVLYYFYFWKDSIYVPVLYYCTGIAYSTRILDKT